MAISLNSYLVFFTLLLLCGLSEAKDFLVGGTTNAWKVPSSSAESLNQWAEANRFQIGDSLVWKYEGNTDSVLQVTRENYLSCNTSNPIAESKDGSTTVKLEKHGAYYFISGAQGACEKGEKVIVVVMSNRQYHFFSISPAPSPAEVGSPAAAPVSSASQLASLGRCLVSGVAAVATIALVL